MDFIEKTLKSFLNLYWIRPETAIWRTLDVIQMKNLKFTKPIIDLGCGDGTFSFVNFSGNLNSSYDVYQTMNSTKEFFKGRDIHDQFSNVKPKIVKKPQNTIDVGLDWKSNLLAKAENLKLYEKVSKHNLSNNLPFEDNQFETIFSNVFYWIKNLKKLIRESSRILTPSGKIIILVPDKKLKKYLIYNQYIENGHKWAKILDRGIYSHITNHCYTFSEWKKMFEEAGLKIDFHSTHLSSKFIKFWSIGMRPYSPYIIEMSNELKLANRNKIKNRLVNETYPLMRSFVDYEINSSEKEHCFHLFVLKQK